MCIVHTPWRSNTNDFFAPLFAVFDHLYTHRFSKRDHADLYQIAATPTEAVTQIVEYQPPALATKWFHQQG